jgi:hypothetical protein
MTPELEEEIANGARSQVAAAFDDADEIVECLCEIYSDDAPEEEVRPVAERATAEAVREHLAAEKTWPIPTDCDRLDRAFAALEKAGVVARQNWTCCQTCGHAEIGAELADDSIGYTFYHQQDTESAVEGYGICLAYGATSDAPGATAAIARRVVEVLEREGLRVDWNGSTDRRIEVSLDWKRRRRF